MNNELAVSGNTQTALSAGGLGFDDGETLPSYIELVQRTSQVDGAIPGKFRDKESNQHFDSLELIPLQFSTSRVLFPPGGDLNQEPLCRSNDGIVPALKVLQPQASSCSNCSQSSWDGYVKGSGVGIPQCKEKMRLLFIDRETNLPYYLTVGGRSIQPMKSFYRTLKKYHTIAKAKGEVVNIFDFATTIRPLAIKGPKGSYFVATFDPPKRVKESDLGKFGPLYTQLVLQRNNAAATAAAAADNNAFDEELTEA